MNRYAKLTLATGLVLAVVGCSSDDSTQSVDTTHQAFSEEQSGDLRIDALYLQLGDERSGVLGLEVAPTERKIIEQGFVTLQLNRKEEPVTFNDRGEEGDIEARDGIFMAKVPVDLKRLEALAQETQQVRSRVISTFTPGSREVVGRERLPKTGLDLEALRAGKLVRLPPLAKFGVFESLGAGSSVPIDWQKSLLVRTIPVIEDGGRTANPCASIATNTPLRTWTFGHLMREMSQGSGLSESDFVEQWLEHWRAQQQVFDTSGTTLLDDINDNAHANIDALVINPWRQRSGGGALDLSIAPFRLQAIVYRPDLAVSSPYGGGASNNGGELRFVFGMMEVRDNNGDGDALDAADTCQSFEAAVIFEYGVPLSSCTDIKAWANDWVSLSAELPGTPAYNGALENLTEAVVLHGSDPAKPNQNALNQLRTNEIALTGIWQFREFHLASSGLLEQTTTKNNPREHQASFTSVPGSTPTPIDLNGTSSLLNEIQANVTAIVGDDYGVPETSSGQPFLGGASSYNLNTAWDHPGLVTTQEIEARFKFSLNTCSGCHTGETNTTFYHIRPSGPGSTPILSNFLLNNPHTVTDVRSVSHTFNEMDNRKQSLSLLANQSCSFLLGQIPFELLHAPLQSVH